MLWCVWTHLWPFVTAWSTHKQLQMAREVGASSFVDARYWTIMPGPLSCNWEGLGSTSEGGSWGPVDVRSIHGKMEEEEGKEVQKWLFNGDHIADSDALVILLKIHSHYVFYERKGTSSITKVKSLGEKLSRFGSILHWHKTGVTFRLIFFFLFFNIN